MNVVVLAPEKGRIDVPRNPVWSAHDVTVVGWAGGADVDIPVEKPHGLLAATERVLVRTVAGRVLRRLTPFDPGVRFWAAFRNSRRAWAALERADVVVANERDAYFSAYRIAKRFPGVRVVAGHLPATQLLRS